MSIQHRLVTFLVLGLVLSTNLFSQSLILSHVHGADPSAHVWPNDSSTLWIYTSHDEPGTNHYYTMNSYHAFSTQDLVNWTDHGRILAVEDVDWAITMAWATDAVYWKGTYYLVYCMQEEKTSTFRTGLAKSDAPQGPFEDIGFIKHVENGQDPALFVDGDTPYLFWGYGKQCFAGELSQDLLSLKQETLVDLSDQLQPFFEGPWVHKYQEKYYLSYPGLTSETPTKWQEEMFYSVADKPLGPYEFIGKYIGEFQGQSGTNHGSIVKFKEDWIAFYHSAMIPNKDGHARSLMADYLSYDTTGVIQPIQPNEMGISKGTKGKVTIHLEAESTESQGGAMGGTEIDDRMNGYSGTGYVTGFDLRQDYVEVLVQVAQQQNARLKIHGNLSEDTKTDIYIDNYVLDGWSGTQLTKTDGWEIIDIGNIPLKSGDNLLRITTHTNVNFSIDYFQVEPVTN